MLKEAYSIEVTNEAKLTNSKYLIVLFWGVPALCLASTSAFGNAMNRNLKCCKTGVTTNRQSKLKRALDTQAVPKKWPNKCNGAAAKTKPISKKSHLETFNFDDLTLF